MLIGNYGNPFDEDEVRLMQRVFNHLTLLVDYEQRAVLAAAVYSATLECQTFDAMVEEVCRQLCLDPDERSLLN